MDDINGVSNRTICEKSKLTLPERQAALSWFATQSEEVKIMIMKKHSALIHQTHVKGVGVTPYQSYALLAFAAKLTRVDLTALALKRDLSILETETISRLKIEGYLEKPRRKKPQKKLIQFRRQFFPLVTLLKETHGFSWKQVTGYLYEHHKFEISKAHIQQVYKILKSEVTTNGN